jgi:FkbM family methyltransferase
MTGLIKKWLLRILGQERYLTLTSTIFFISFQQGRLRKNPAYFTHYLVGSLIKPGFTIIDIGANLGYYSVLFAHRTGPSGKVVSVEPIELYRRVLQKNIAGLKQVHVLPYALGEHEGVLKMGNPSKEQHRHGLMKVLKEEETAEIQYEVPVKNPVSLFSDLEKIDYIKCDIEGYEVPVIPAMRSLIEKHMPILQIETEGENKKILMLLLEELGYNTYYAGPEKFEPYNDVSLPLPGDLIAIPKDRIV